jgi:histidine ammonia-lyase
VEAKRNAAGDKPVVVREERFIVSHGNVHPAGLAHTSTVASSSL